MAPKKISKISLIFPETEPVRAEVSSLGILAVHKTLGAEKGYVLTHLPTMKCVLRTRLKREAVEALWALEAVFETGVVSVVRRVIGELRQKQLDKAQ